VTLLRRYAPFLVLAAAQLFIITVVPSREPAKVVTGLGGPEVAAPQGPAGTALLPSGDTTATTGPGGVTTPGGRVTARASTAVTNSPGVLTAGDTRHCVGGYQFGGLREGGTPPCAPKFAGNNGGPAGKGVSANTVEVVYYRLRDNPVVKQLLQTLDLYASPLQAHDFMDAASNFMNARYEFYGRRVHWNYVDGQCLVTPPQVDCLRSEAHAIAERYHPFAAVWERNTVVPEWNDQLYQDGVISVSGWHFDDSFNVAHRPYHYDVLMGGTFQSQLTGDYWCRRLAGHRAQYAGDPNGVLQLRTRRLAIVVQEYELNVKAANALKAIVDRCDPNGAQIFTYSSDLATAQEQSVASTQAIRNSGATSVMYFGDPIAPAFGTAQATAQQYYPEYPLAGSGLIDYDILARLYDKQQWAHAFGVSDLVEMYPFPQSDAATVYRQGKGTNDISPLSHSANLPWGYFRFIAYGIQQSGPRLTAAAFENAVLNGPSSGGWNNVHNPHLYYLKFGPGDYTAISDAREVYYDPNAISEIDGRAGAYVQCDGGHRYAIGEWPTGEPTFPCR
jgi:hypothetical protein